MTSPTVRSRNAFLTAFSASLVVLGALLLLAGIVLDWSGFWGGAGLGAGVALAVVGAYLGGYANGLRRAGSAAVWIPSSGGGE